MKKVFCLPVFPRMESVSELGKNLAGTDVIVPDASDGSPPEDPYADGWSNISQLSLSHWFQMFLI